MKQLILVALALISVFGTYHVASKAERRKAMSKKNKGFAIGAAVIVAGVFIAAAILSTISIKVF